MEGLLSTGLPVLVSCNVVLRNLQNRLKFFAKLCIFCLIFFHIMCRKNDKDIREGEVEKEPLTPGDLCGEGGEHAGEKEETEAEGGNRHFLLLLLLVRHLQHVDLAEEESTSSSGTSSTSGSSRICVTWTKMALFEVATYFNF